MDVRRELGRRALGGMGVYIVKSSNVIRRHYVMVSDTSENREGSHCKYMNQIAQFLSMS